MKKPISIIISIACIITMFTGCFSHSANNYGSSNSSVIEPTEKGANKQYTVKNVLQKTIPTNTKKYYNYAQTNGKEYLSNIYYLKVDPNEISNDYENNYHKKYTYSFLDGDSKNKSIQVQLSYRDEIGEEARLSYKYFFIRGINHNDKLEAYHSYDIGETGTEYDDEYYRYTYDDDGKLSKYSDDTNTESYFTYDSDGQLSNKTGDLLDAYDSYSFTYEKDENGNISVVTEFCNDYKFDNNVTLKFVYEYDGQNRIINETKYLVDDNSTEEMRCETTYSYDEDGNVASVVTNSYNTDTEKFELTTDTYTYTSENNIAQITSQTESGTEYIIFEYSDSPNSYTDYQD